MMPRRCLQRVIDLAHNGRMNPGRTRWLGLAVVLMLQGCADVPLSPPKIERMSAAELEARLPQPVAALPLEQIVTLARQGIGAEEIIGRITQSGSRYRLSASQIVELRQQGVPLKVLDHMVVAERTRIFDDMAGEAASREKACLDRIEKEVQWCRNQAMPMMWFPRHQPFMNCFPPLPGSLHWRCL